MPDTPDPQVPPDPDTTSDATTTSTTDPTLASSEVTKSVTTRDTQSVLDAMTVIDALENGASLREAALKVGVSHTTAWRWLRQYEGSQESVAKYLAIRALGRVEDWEKASQQAAEKGDHRPARDWLLHAKAIEPVAGEQGGGARVNILIGTPEQPIKVAGPIPDVVVDPL